MFRVVRGIAILAVVGYGVLLYSAYKAAEAIPAEVVLKLNFERPFPDVSQTSQLFPVLTLQDVVDGLDAAAKDPRVKGIIATVGSEVMELPIAQVQELRDALKKFRDAHKTAVCHSEGFGGNNTDYYLATAFDQIVMQPSGWLNLTGVAMSATFLRGLFEKLEIEPRLLQRHEYKSFANTFNEKGFTPAHKESVDAMATSLHKQLLQDISDARGIAPKKLQALMDQGPLLPRDARDAGLIDEVAYRDKAYSLITGKVLDSLKHEQQGKPTPEVELAKAVLAVPVKKVKFMSFKKYVKKTKEEKELEKLKKKKDTTRLMAADTANFQALKQVYDKQEHPEQGDQETLKTSRRLARRAARGKTGVPKVAVIYATGEISSGHHEKTGVVASKTFSTILRTVARDQDVKAIVLRVNSPGGSAVGSDTIWWETIRAKEAGLPLVVSMGDYAASGGYYISAAADRIIAQPGTITGSIGVIFGKMVIGKFLANKLGITQESVEKGKHANIMSAYYDWKPSELKLCNKLADESYKEFVTKVAAGRGITYEEAHKIAKGRAWTGTEAKEIGLVDELGGLSRAVEVAKELAGPLPPGVDYEVTVFPRPKGLRELLLKGSAVSESAEDEDEEPDSGSGLGGLMDESMAEWAAAAKVVHFLSSIPALKPLMRQLESGMRASSGPQYRMNDVSVGAKESDLV